MNHNKWLVGLGLTVGFIALASASWIVWKKQLSNDTVVGQSTEQVAKNDQLETTDWCASEEFYESFKKTTPFEYLKNTYGPGGPSQTDVDKYYSKEFKSYLETMDLRLALANSSNNDVKLSRSEVCVVSMIQTRDMDYALEHIDSDANKAGLSIEGLTKYLGRERAMIVFNSIEVEFNSLKNKQGVADLPSFKGSEEIASIVIAFPHSVIRDCITEKSNRILEPKQGSPICMRGSGVVDDREYADFDGMGMSWGGCDFAVMRNEDGRVTDFRYCAILKSKAVVTCTINDCSYKNTEGVVVNIPLD